MATSGFPAATGGPRDTGVIVEVVDRRRARRSAKVAFLVVLAVVTPTVSVVAAVATGPVRAVTVGVVAGVLSAVVVGLATLVWPALRPVWWWACELLVLAGLLAAFRVLSTLVPWPVALGVLAAATGGLLMYGRSRRLLVAWVWCAISRHRLRTCFATFIRANRRGSLPLILVAWPVPAGERVLVVLRPGLAVDDLTADDALARLAVGCWAREVRVSRASGRFAPLVRVDVIRREPPAGTVASPVRARLTDLPSTGVVDDHGPVERDRLAADLPAVPRPRRALRSLSAPPPPQGAPQPADALCPMLRPPPVRPAATPVAPAGPTGRDTP